MDGYSPGDLTVIVVAYQARATIGACLRALAVQTVQGFRIIVVDSSTDRTADVVAREFPDVELIRSAHRLFPGDARNAGIAKTAAPLIAFVDSDCVAAPDWVERLLAVHAATGRWIVGGSVGVANPESLAGWALYFSEFSTWMPRAEAREMIDIPTCCLSFRREAFERLGPFLEGTYCSDTVFNWRAGEAGHRPWFDPNIHVRHTNPVSAVAMMRKLRMHGETFARVRSRHEKSSRAVRIARAVASALLLPWVLWARVARRVVEAPREYRLPFVRSTPLLLAGLAAWSWGEAVGYAGFRGEEGTHAVALEPAGHVNG